MTQKPLKTIHKSLLVSALATTALATTTVEADQMTPSVTENKETTETTMKTPTSSKDLKPVVETAKKRLETTTDNYNQKKAEETAQKEQVTTATYEVTTATDNLKNATDKQAEAEEIEKTSTPEAIAKQEEKIEVDKTAISEKEADLKTANDKLTATTDEVAQKEADLTTAQKDIETQDQTVKQAQKEVETAKATLEGTDQGKLLKEASDLKETILTNKKEVTEKTTALETAKQEESKLQEAIKQQTENLETALTNAGNPEIVETKKTVVGTAPFDYRYTDGNGGKTGVVLHEQVTYADGVIKEEIIRDTSKTKWDTDKLAQYVAKYVNELRRLNGIDKPVTVTPAAMRYAADRAKEMDNGSFGHKTKLEAKDYGYEQSNEGIQFILNTDPYRKGYLRSEQEVAYNLVQGLFSDYNNLTGDNYGHREAILNSGSDIGVAVHYKGRQAVFILDYMGDFDNVWDNSDFTTTNNDDDPTKSEHWYKGRRLVALPKAEMNYITVENITKPNQAYLEAKKSLEDYKGSATTQLKKQAQTVSDLTAQQARAKEELAKNQATLQALESQLASLSASVEEKAKTLTTAQEKLDAEKENLAKATEVKSQKEALLKEAKEKQAKAQEGVQTATKTLEVAKEELTTDLAQLDKLTHAKENLEKASQEVKVAQEKQKEALKNLETQENLLKEKEKATATAKAELDKAQADFDKLNEEYTALLQVEKAKEKKTTNTYQPSTTPILASSESQKQQTLEVTPTKTDKVSVNNTNQVAKTQKTSTVPTSAPQKATPTKQTSTAKITNKTLPNTGTKNTSLLAMMGLTLLSLLSFYKKRIVKDE